MCTAVFHYDCNVNIKDGEGFIYHAFETMKNLAETIKERGMKTRIDRVIKDFREEISHIQNNIKALEDEVARNQIGCTNVDDFVKKTKSLAKSIMESHIYSVYTDYIQKLKICEIVPNKLDDDGEMGLYRIRTQFYLDAKKKEMDFWEYKLRALAQQINTRVNLAKTQSEQKFAAVDNRISQEAELTKTGIEELKQLMLNMFKEMKEEHRSKFEEISSKVDRHKKIAVKNNKLFEEHKEELKINLEDHKLKIDIIQKKQEEMGKDIVVANKNAEERQIELNEKADELKKKIDELVIESNSAKEKIESFINEIYQKIKSSKERLKKKFKLKIGKIFDWI